MARMRGSDALLNLLRQEGVTHIYGNPGTTELALMDALVGVDDPDYVLALHEGSAMGMAHGHAVATGRLAMVNLHAAPGLGNALGMLYNAKKAGAPVLVTAGTHRGDINLTEPLLWDDLATMARPLVKWAHEVRSVAELPRAVHRAATVALAHPTGPVFLSIPDDVLSDVGEVDLGGPSRMATRIGADPDAIARAAAMLATARAPMIFAGDIVAHMGAHAELTALAEAIGAPVYLEAMADTASFPATHPLFAGLVPRVGTQAAAVLDGYDVIVSVGGDLFTLSLPSGTEPVPAGIPIVHIDVDPWQLGKNYPEAVSILADPRSALSALTAALTPCGDAPARRQAIVAANAARRVEWHAKAAAAAEAFPIQPVALLAAIGRMLPPDTIVVEELLSSNPGVRDLVPVDRPDGWFGMRGGGIGMAMPQAVGAKIARPDRPVVVLVGDGSALYNIQALWTAANRRLPIPFVVFNNKSYRILKQRTRALGGNSADTGSFVAMDMTDPPIDHGALARGFGARTVTATTIAEVAAALTDALAADGPTLIDVAVASAP